MKKVFYFVTIAIVFASACNKNNVPEIQTDNRSIVYDLEDKAKESVFVASALPDYISEAFQLRFEKTAPNIDEAEIIILNSSDLAANKEAIKKAWEEGRIIVEIQPQNKTHYDFWTSIGVPYYLSPEESTNDLLFIAIHEFECYQFQNPFFIDDYLSDVNAVEEEAEESKDVKERVNVNYVPVEIEEDAEYLNTKLDSFVDWLNENPASENVPMTKASPSSDLSELIEDSKFSQILTKDFTIGVDSYPMCKVIWSDPDYVTRHSKVEVKITVTPVYAYELNKADAGDYYFITMTVLVHNAPMYGTYKEWHGWVTTYAHALFSRSIDWNTSLNVSPDRLSFYRTPQPTSTESSGSYSTGFAASLNVSGQGGIAGGNLTLTATVGGTFTWSHSESRTIKDQSVEMSTSPYYKGVSYKYVCNNFLMEDDTQMAVPAIARNDQKCEASWCWKVSGTKDEDKTERFTLNFSLDPIYAYLYRHATWGVEGNFVEGVHVLPESKRTCSFPILPPDRTRKGILEFKCTNSQYITHIKVLNTKGEVVADSGSAYQKNVLLTYTIPVGTYSVEYDVQDGDTAVTKGHYRISDVVINTDKKTETSSLDGKKVQ
ncbi:MAG: hypothetical protein ACI4TM_01255 [Candidatus Cryptobacteroides sp.]